MDTFYSYSRSECFEYGFTRIRIRNTGTGTYLPIVCSLMAALLGNHVLTEADLSTFHARLIPKLDNKVSRFLTVPICFFYIRLHTSVLNY